MAWKRGCIDLFTGWQFKIRTGIFQRVYLLCQKLFIVIPDYRSTTAKTTLTRIFVNAIFGEGLVKTYVPLLSEHHKWPYFYYFALCTETKFRLNISQLKNIKLLFKNNIHCTTQNSNVHNIKRVHFDIKQITPPRT